MNTNKGRLMPNLVRRYAVTLLFLSSCSLAAADRPAVSCYRLDLQNPPDWITSGATWDRDKERLLMVDPISDRVVSYNLLGERETIPSLSGEPRPVKISRLSDGFLLELADGTMLSLDRRLAVRDRDFVVKQSSDVDISLYQWSAEDSGSLTAFAAVVPKDENKGIQYGFFRVQKSSMQLLLAADKNQEGFFRFGYPYIASAAGGDTFFLSMAKHPALYRVSNGKAEKLTNALPRQYATRPDFTTPLKDARTAVARYAELETFSIPAGLYTQDGYVYLLTREPAGGGNTAWWLHQINPAGKGSLLGRVRLPTSAKANHLTVIPTPDRGWMFIERGKAELDSSQRQIRNASLGPAVVISNAAIRSLSLLTSCPGPEEEGIFWADHKHSKALFVPEPLLASEMMLPVDVSSQKHIDLRRAGEPPNVSPCDFLEPSRGQGTLPNARRLEDLVTSSPVAVVGKIVSTEPGWDARLSQVVTKVNLEVKHSLKGALGVGSRIDFLSPGGSMLFDDKRICTFPRKGFYQPRAGDEILISAKPSDADSRLLESPYVFPLSGGKVQPEPYPALLSKQKPLSLSKLLDSSNKGTI